MEDRILKLKGKGKEECPTCLIDKHEPSPLWILFWPPYWVNYQIAIVKSDMISFSRVWVPVGKTCQICKNMAD